MEKKRGKIILTLLMFGMLFCVGVPQNVKADEGNMIKSLSVSVGKKGFHPSKGNYLRIKTYVDTTYTEPYFGNMVYGTADIWIRIRNKKGQCVFTKSYRDSTGGYIDYKWNGKPGKKNEAGLSAGSYVKNGTYTVEVSVIPSADDTAVSEKSCSFQVSSKAASGANGLSEAKTVPILTGNDRVDYMAEQICRDAKVKTSLSESEKVRRIYHWMTVHQKHVHYYEGGSFKKYYKLFSSKKKIKEYKASCGRLLEAGKLIYNNDYRLINQAWCMERRIGVCSDHAAIFKILCNHVGIEAGICSGYYLNRNGTKPPHSWNYAIVDGVTWYYDVDVEIQNYQKGQGDYYWYQKTKKQAKATHQFETVE